MRRIALLALLGLGLAALVASCGEKSEPLGGRTERLSVMLDFFPNADHAPLYTAQRRGYFKQAGLDVQILSPPDPAAPLKLLAAGKVDVAISYQPEVLLARARRTPLVSVGAFVDEPLTSLMALPRSGVRRPADLQGRTVGTAGIPYQSAYLREIARRARVRSVSQVDVGFNLNRALLSGRVDATLGGFSNYEAIQLRQEGKRPVVIPVDRAGVPRYDELVLVARKGFLGESGDRVRSFVQALGRGARAVRADPSRAVDDLLEAVPDLRPQRRLEEASVRATLPGFTPPPGRPFGWQDPAAWARYGAWMRQAGLVQGDPRARDALTNEFLAGQGV